MSLFPITYFPSYITFYIMIALTPYYTPMLVQCILAWSFGLPPNWCEHWLQMEQTWMNVDLCNYWTWYSLFPRTWHCHSLKRVVVGHALSWRTKLRDRDMFCTILAWTKRRYFNIPNKCYCWSRWEMCSAAMAYGTLHWSMYEGCNFVSTFASHATRIHVITKHPHIPRRTTPLL